MTSNHAKKDKNGSELQDPAINKEPIQLAKQKIVLNDHNAVSNASEILADCDSVFDIEDVQWFIDMCSKNNYGGDKVEWDAFRTEALRLLTRWASGLQANILADGVPVEDPLRDELIDSAVTFLEDTQVKNRNIIEKVQFLQDKGLNSTEIGVAFTQVGLEFPASMMSSTPIRKDMLSNGVGFLNIPNVKEKPLEERIAFLKSRGLTSLEIVRCCELAKTERVLSLQEVSEIKPYVDRAPREDMIINGAKFMQNETVGNLSLRKKIEFLKLKGLTREEIRQVCHRVGVNVSSPLEAELFGPRIVTDNFGVSIHQENKLASNEGTNNNFSQGGCAPDGKENSIITENSSKSIDGINIREDSVKNGITFLKHPIVQTQTPFEKLLFLRRKGLSEAEIKESFFRAGIETQYSSSSKDINRSSQNNPYSGTISVNAEKAVAFLKHPSVQGRTMREKIEVLQSKGISLDDIEQACNVVGISTNNVASINMDDFPPSTSSVKTCAGIRGNNVSAGGESNSELSDKNEGDIKVEMLKSSLDRTSLETTKKCLEEAKKFILQHSDKLDVPDKTRLLLAKGLTVNEIIQIFSLVGLDLDAAQPETQKVLKDGSKDDLTIRSLRFLLDKKTQPFSISEKIAYLRNHDVSDEQIKSAFRILSLGDASVTLHKTDENDSNENKPKVDGVEFLKNSKTSLSSDESKLINTMGKNDISEKEIEVTCIPANLDLAGKNTKNYRAIKVETGKSFLENNATQDQPVSAKVEFLKSKGFTDTEVCESFRLAGFKQDSSEEDLRYALYSQDNERPEMVRLGYEFLRNPKTEANSFSEKAEFLRSKGLNDREIKKAFDSAGLFLEDTKLEKNVGSSASSKVSQAIQFLQKTKNQHSEEAQRTFLRNKGLCDTDIEDAFRNSGIKHESLLLSPSDLRLNLIEKSVAFLKDPATTSLPMNDRLTYLRNKGMSEKEIERALDIFDSSINSDGKKTLCRQDFVERGASFLLNSSVKEIPIEERVSYLYKQGLNKEEIEQAAIRANLSMTPSHLSTIPIELLKGDRFRLRDDMDATGKALQGAINCAVDVLLDLKSCHDSSSVENRTKPRHTLLAAQSMALLATAICRCRSSRVSPSCVAFAAGVIPVALQSNFVLFDSSSSFGVPTSSDLIEHVVNPHAELIARATQINLYIKNGLNQLQQINLHFIKNVELLTCIMKMWVRNTNVAIKFSHGVVLSRAMHGQFIPIAAAQPFDDASGPVIECLVEHLSAPLYAQQDIASYLAAGLLRGAPDYSWAKDVSVSPQPKIEDALQRLANSAVLRGEKFESSLTNADDTIGSSFLSAVGLACVYCDAQLHWTPAIIMAVTEGLLTASLWCEEMLSSQHGSNGLDAIVLVANAFVNEEVFKLSPRLVSLILSNLLPFKKPGPNIITNSKGTVDSVLREWMIRRLNTFSNRIYLACRQSPDICGIVARRTVQFVHGVGDEDATPNSNELATRNDQEELEIIDTVDDANISAEAELPISRDPLKEFFGIHSAIAVTFQSCYLASVLIGSQCVTDVDHNSCLCMLDTLANLNAFQVRVDDAVNLEKFLTDRVGMKYEGSDDDDVAVKSNENSICFFGLLERHVREHDSVMVVKQNTGDNKSSSASQPLFDWVLGARVELLLRLGESLLLPLFIQLGNDECDDLEETMVLPSSVREPITLLYEPKSMTATSLLESYELLHEKSHNQAQLKKSSTLQSDAQRENKEAMTTLTRISFQPETLHRFTTGMCELLIEVGIRHPFVHLNHRVHRWMTSMIAESNTEQSISGKFPPMRLACVPRYLSTTLNSFPSTPANTIFFVVSFVLTALGNDTDSRSQAVSIVGYEKIALAVSQSIGVEKSNREIVGPIFFTLLFTALKIMPLSALPSAMQCALEIIHSTPKAVNQENETTGKPEDLESLVPLSHEWLLECLFGVISRTDNAPRRLLLCKWYLQKVQNLTTTGKM